VAAWPRQTQRTLAPRRFLRVAFLIAIFWAPAGCSTNLSRELHAPARVPPVSERCACLKAHLKNGQTVVFESWHASQDGIAVSGEGIRLGPARDTLGAGACSVPLDSVALFETDRLSPSPPVVGLTLVSVASAGLSVYCLTHPKACFGSCPTFYLWDGTAWRLSAEGFSASVAPSLEATDVDALPCGPREGGELELRMRNEALETHVVRHADLLAVPVGAGARALLAPDGSFREATALLPPTECAGAEGDCLEMVARFDGRERCSLADSVDLASREALDIRFSVPSSGFPRAGAQVGVVIAARQSLLTTYLFYQTLAYLGTQAGRLIAALGDDEAARGMYRSFHEVLGGIEVLSLRGDSRPGDDAWVSCGAFRETGPLACDVRVIPLPGDTIPDTVRLRMAKGNWRIDWIALAVLGAPREAVRIHPVEVERNGRVDGQALASLLEKSSSLVTLPGDSCSIRYCLPTGLGSCQLFLESRGYYLEWMREGWLAEESGPLAAMMLLDPEQGLRRLAREFKKSEAGMEAAFWSSRYARP